MEAPAEDPMGRGAEGDREAGELLEGLGLSGRWEMQPGSTRLPIYNKCGKAGAGRGRRGERGF